MQDIVYKLVPGMQEAETKRRKEYYAQKRADEGEESDEGSDEYPVPFMNGQGMEKRKSMI